MQAASFLSFWDEFTGMRRPGGLPYALGFFGNWGMDRHVAR